MENLSSKPESEKEKELRRIVQMIIEDDLNCGSNSKDKYSQGSLKDEPEGYMNKVIRLVDIAMSDPNSPERKKAQEKISASFTN